MERITIVTRVSAFGLCMLLLSSSFFVTLGHSQTNEQLLEMIQQIRGQMEAQQIKLQQLELQLKQRMESQKETVAAGSGQAETVVNPPAVREAMPAQANEWYIGGFVGGAFLQNTDVRTNVFPNEFFGLVSKTLTGANVSLDSSPAVGAKAGGCPSFFLYLCSELEFDYFQPKLAHQFTGNVPRIGAGLTPDTFFFFLQTLGERTGQLPRFDFNVHNLGLNLIGRLPLIKEPGYPLGGRMHLYLGAGPSFVWTKAQNKDCLASGSVESVFQTEEGLQTIPLGVIECAHSDTRFDVGVQALGGAKFFMTKNLALFGEYKFKHWNADFNFPSRFVRAEGSSFDPSNLQRLQGTFLRNVDFNAHLFYLGMAYHW